MEWEIEARAIADMIEGRLMPQQPRILAEVLAITYVGVGPLPKNWLRSTFRVRRYHVGEALLWLKMNNPKYYGDIEITNARLDALPEDDIPFELLINIHQETSSHLATMESASYGGPPDIATSM